METQHERARLVCLTGPESSGKTTLAEALARHLGAPLVPEVARSYLAGRAGYQPEDLLAIAEAQLAAETAALESGAPLVIADTDLLVIRIWWEEKYGPLDARLEADLTLLTPRLYLLAAPDIPWQPDPLRESPHDRERLFQRHVALLESLSAPYRVIRGARQTRLQTALEAMQEWLEGDEAPGG
ncbi:MAG: ATP-binding protein [Pseudomonadales bacterium]